MEITLPPAQIGIVVSTYNSNITQRLLEGAQATLADAGYGAERLAVVRVPGAWELPLAARQLAARPEICGLLTLGAVIRGETSHDQHINRAVSQAEVDHLGSVLRMQRGELGGGIAEGGGGSSSLLAGLCATFEQKLGDAEESVQKKSSIHKKTRATAPRT